MADDFASAMLTFRSQVMNSALEAIEVMGNAVHHNFERLVILVPAHFTSIHKPSFLFVLLLLLVAARCLARRPVHLIVLGFFDAFLNQLFGESLLVGGRNFRRFAPFIFRDLEPSLILRHSLGGSKLRIEQLLARQFSVSLLKIPIQYLFRVAVYFGDFASALQHYFPGYCSESVPFFGKAALLDILSFHSATYAAANR